MAFPSVLAVEVHRTNPTNLACDKGGHCVKCNLFSEIYRIFSVKVTGAVVSKFPEDLYFEFLNPDLFATFGNRDIPMYNYNNRYFNQHPYVNIMDKESMIYFPICSFCQFQFDSQESIMYFIEDIVWKEIELNSHIIKKQNKHRRSMNLQMQHRDYMNAVINSKTIKEKDKVVLIEKTNIINNIVRAVSA